jgi:hypothetical protein
MKYTTELIMELSEIDLVFVPKHHEYNDKLRDTILSEIKDPEERKKEWESDKYSDAISDTIWYELSDMITDLAWLLRKEREFVDDIMKDLNHPITEIKKRYEELRKMQP